MTQDWWQQPVQLSQMSPEDGPMQKIPAGLRIALCRPCSRCHSSNEHCPRLYGSCQLPSTERDSLLGSAFQASRKASIVCLTSSPCLGLCELAHKTQLVWHPLLIILPWQQAHRASTKLASVTAAGMLTTGCSPFFKYLLRLSCWHQTETAAMHIHA